MSIRVLIIDDEKDLSLSLKDYLEDETDFQVLLSFTGESALDDLDTKKPDICIVDMRLPGMTGDEFITEAHRKLPECKFIIHTGSIDYSPSENLRIIGIDQKSIIFKPVWDLSEFHEKILKLLES